MRSIRVLPAFALILGISVLALLGDSTPQPAGAASFAPTQEYQIMTGTTGSTGGSACNFAGAAARQGPTATARCTTTQFDIGLTQQDTNFGEVVTFTDGTFVPPCTKGHSGGTCPVSGGGTVAEIPNGAIIGKLKANATLALLLSYCGFIQVDVDFTLQAATTDTTTATFTYNPATQAVDNAIDSVTNATHYWPGYSDGATTAGAGDAANGLEAGVEKYPAFLNTIFDPDGPGGTAAIQPRARLYGHTNVDNTSSDPAHDTQVPLQFLIFEPGALTSLPGLQNFTADLGYPSVTILNDPTVPGNPSLVTNFCTPLTSKTITYGTSQDNLCDNAAANNDDDGCPRNIDCSFPPAVPSDPCPLLRSDSGVDGYTNEGGITGTCDSGSPPFQGNCQVSKTPSATGTVLYRTHASGFRDLDNDGFENELDTCPYSVDPTWDPTSISTTTGDTAGDGIPNSCDTTPDVFTSDQDSDAFLSPQDNCPTVANSFGASPDTLQNDGAVVGVTTVKSANDIEFPTQVDDGGSRSDGIGAACDDSDRDAREGVNVTLRPKGSCVDGRDNDLDGLIDFNDPSCTTTIDGVPADADGLYDASDTDDDNDGTLDTADSSAARPNGHYETVTLIVRVCINTTGTTGGVPFDADNDGVCAGTAGENDITTAYSPAATVNGAQTGTDTSIEYTSAGDPFTVGDSVKNATTGEIFRVTAIDTATNALTVVRGCGAPAAAMANGQVLQNDTSHDTDGDCDLDTVDNCLVAANPNQADMDVEGVGDFCDSNNTNGPHGPFILPDSDGDGFSNAVEQAAGTDPNARCGGTFSWPPDVAVGTEADAAFVDGTDLVALQGQFGLATTAGGGPAPERFDFGPVSTSNPTLILNRITDNFIDGTDLVALQGQFGLKCQTP